MGKINCILMTPREVAERYRVSAKTITRWAASGLLPGIRTPGGKWRFREAEVRETIEGIREEAKPKPGTVRFRAGDSMFSGNRSAKCLGNAEGHRHSLVCIEV